MRLLRPVIVSTFLFAAPLWAGPLADAVQPFVDKHELAGAVMAVADKDKVLAMETAGFSDLASSKPIAQDAVFWIASQSKAMTAAAVMMLVDEGKIKLDDPVERYLPEFKGQMVVVEKDDQHLLLKKPAHPITIRNVLSHTSGLPFSTPVENPTLDMLPLRVAVRSYAMSPLQFEPDTKYQYSNAGINTAARVLEVVSNMPYEDFMRTRLFEPLGMKDTTFHPNTAQIARLAKSYKPNAAKDGLEDAPIGQLYYPLDEPLRQPMPAGGLFSTAADVVLFCQMLMNNGTANGHRILSEAAVKEMTSRQTAKELKESYGFGLSVSPDGFGHGGAYATNMNVSLKRGLITVWLVQHAGFPGEGGKAQGAFSKAAEKFGK